MKIKTALTDWMFLLAELAKEIQSAGAVFILSTFFHILFLLLLL